MIRRYITIETYISDAIRKVSLWAENATRPERMRKDIKGGRMAEVCPLRAARSRLGETLKKS